MTVRSGQSITVEFITSRFDTGAATNADSTPTGTLVVNGTDNGASVTVTNIDAGRYKAVVTLPTLAIGDIVEINVTATVNSVTGKGVIWRDNKDVLLDTSGDVTFNNTSLSGVILASNGLNLVLVDGKTLPVALQYIASSVAGKVSGGGTGTEVFLGLDGVTTRLTITVDANGNRSAITYG